MEKRGLTSCHFWLVSQKKNNRKKHTFILPINELILSIWTALRKMEWEKDFATARDIKQVIDQQ